MPPTLLTNMVFPMLEVANSVMIGGSTPSDSYSAFNRFFLINEEAGQKLINAYQAELVCEPCKLKDANMEECTHMLKLIPPWKNSDPDNFKLMKALFGENKTTLLRETKGLVSDEGTSLIRRDSMMAIRQKIFNYNVMDKPKHILVFCDPNAGGDDHMALVATVFVDGKTVIVAMDSHPVHSTTTQEIVFRDFILAIKKHEWLCDGKILFFGERNTGQEIGHLTDILFTYNNVYSYQQKEDRNYGIWTSHEIKISYAMAARLEVSKGNVHVMKDMISANRFMEVPPDKRGNAMLTELEEQAARYRILSNKPKSPHSGVKMTVTGKVGKNGTRNAAFKDDLMFTFTAVIGVHEKLLTRQLENMDWSMYKI